MSEFLQEPAAAATGSVSRRSMLRRGAAVGAALSFTPVVQVVSISPSSAQSTSVITPPAEPPGEPTECQDISNIQIVVSKEGTYYGLKFDPGDGGGSQFTAWSDAAPDSNDCIRYYVEQTGATVESLRHVANTFNGAAVVDVVSECEWRLRLPLPGGYAFVAGFVKYGDVRSGGCPVAATVTATHAEFRTF